MAHMVVDGRTTVDSDETAILDAAILALVPARPGVGGARVGTGCGGATGRVDHWRDCGGWHMELVDGRAAECAPAVLSVWARDHHDVGGGAVDTDSGG